MSIPPKTIGEMLIMLFFAKNIRGADYFFLRLP